MFTEKAKNDGETSNGHKTALECPISANDHFSESLWKDACIRTRYTGLQNSKLPKN